jgi:DNA-binding response OmpR family regulator
VEEAVMVLVPAEPVAADEALADALAGQDRRVGALERARHRERAEVAVSGLRRKLGSRAGAVETVRGVGYRLREL